MKLWDVITYPCPNFNGDLDKLLFNDWAITPPIKERTGMLLFIRAETSVDQTSADCN